MQATALTLALVGLQAHPIRVEVDSGRGPASFHLVGLAEACVRESRVRVQAALRQIGVDLAEYVITVNLAPADLRKSGGAFDLALAIASMAALGKVPADDLEGTVLLGELSLTGAIQSVRGVLPALFGAKAAGLRRAIVPRANGHEAASVPGVDVFVAEHLGEVVDHFKKGKPLDRASSAPSSGIGSAAEEPDMAEVRGQCPARRALEVAASGGHNLLMVGPPGAGKTMLARRLATLLPPLSPEESLEVTAVHSVAGLLEPHVGLLSTRPFRAPHHSVSMAGLVGGGDPLRPGEVSLAHHGCLFLDELLEFRRSVLESLRQPIEDGQVTLARARARAVFPARPMLVAAVNPCPCGYHGDRAGRCECTPERVRSYFARLSGPLLDRIDLHVSLPPVDVASLHGRPGESSSVVRARVMKARGAQADRRAGGEVRATTNAALSAKEVERVARPDKQGTVLIANAVEHHGLSARAYGRVLRVARTFADLEGSTAVRSRHVGEAILTRLLDREMVYPDAQAVAAAS